MEEQLNYCPMLSLKEIVLRKIAVILFNDTDILVLIAKLDLDVNDDKFREIWQDSVHNKVLGKALKLGLPKSLSKLIIELLLPIGLQIQQWKNFHEQYLSDGDEKLDATVLKLLVWSCDLTLDYKKTAEVLVSFRIFDVEKCYKLACLYCLENDISFFWKKLSEQERQYFHDDENLSEMDEPHLEFCWPYILYEEQSKLENIPGRLIIGQGTSFHQYVFVFSAFKGNKAAAEYFFQKLQPEERETSLFQAVDNVVSNRGNNMLNSDDDFPKERLSDVLCYLLSLMTPEEKLNIFKEHSSEILPCFFDWPWQDYFLQIIQPLWTLIPQSDYSDLLLNILNIIKNSGHYFPRLFQEFFHNSPTEFKDEFVTDDYISISFFTEFLKNQDFESIKVVYRDVDRSKRVKFICSESYFELCEELIKRDKWDLIELFLQEATLAIKDWERLKIFSMKYLTKTHIEPEKWKRFLHLINKSFPEKRISPLRMWSIAKRLRPSK